MIGGRRALVAGLLVTAPVACADDPDGRGESSPPSPEASGSVATATHLEAVAGCEGEGPNNHVADLTWQPAEPPGERQRLVLSYLEGGLDTDAFVPSPALPADRSSYHWIQMGPGTETRYWRVLTYRDGEWLPSETATFPGVDCPGVAG